MQLCTLRSGGGKKLLSDTLVLLIISNLYFCVNVFFVYHDYRVRNLCKYTWSYSRNGTVCSLLHSSFPPHWHNVSGYLLPCRLQSFALHLFPVALLLALCLQYLHFLMLILTCFPPHTAAQKRYLTPSSAAIL